MNKGFGVQPDRPRIIFLVSEHASDLFLLDDGSEGILLKIGVIGREKHAAQSVDDGRFFLSVPAHMLFRRFFRGNIPPENIYDCFILLAQIQHVLLHPYDRFPFAPVLVHLFQIILHAFRPFPEIFKQKRVPEFFSVLLCNKPVQRFLDIIAIVSLFLPVLIVFPKINPFAHSAFQIDRI